MTTRVDAGVGLDPVQDFTNVFEFKSVPVAGVANKGTEMVYAIRFTMGLGPVGKVLLKVLEPRLRKSFQQPMCNLEDLVVAEGDVP